MTKRLPNWLKVKIPQGSHIKDVRLLLDSLKLNTVCDSARCPNRAECFGAGTATFMILGTSCTRNCSFCAVSHGKPEPVDSDEPNRIAEAVAKLKLHHAVITSVTRDDLPDGGASHFAATVRAIKKRLPHSTVEILTPDFKGDETSIKIAADSLPHLFNHNIETVQRLYPLVRPQADYKRSLMLLHLVKKLHPQMITKSGLMVGLGETYEEVLETFRDLRKVGCDVVTVGQYLKPAENRIEVVRYWHPDEFNRLKKDGEKLGFLAVYSGPLVRSSYSAASLFSRIKNIDTLP
ncbi:MAG: lipoyl synthase [Planctomycetota bacterium]|nr:lipoyl synthase [Planctomycetota bacterium]